MNDVYGKIAWAIGGVIALICIGTFYMQQSDFEGAWLKLKMTQDRVAEVEQDLEQARAKAEITAARPLKVNHRGEEGIKVIHEIDDAKIRIAALNKKLVSSLRSFQQVAQSVRNGSIAMKEVQLRNGTKLTNARFQKMSEQGAVVAHDAGISRVDFSQLPDDVVAMLRPDIERRLVEFGQQP